MNPKKSKWLVIFSLVFAGEMIFGLPFHIARFFRPTLMDVFHLSHTDLGDVFAIYGITAMIAYFPGGVIADRFSDRKLMTVALLATGIGGFYMLQIPGQIGLSVLFGYWGVSTILLFWAAMLRATRLWGGDKQQGEAFGILDGGRGLVAALVAWIAVIILGNMLSGDNQNPTIVEQTNALKAVITLYIAMTFLAAGLIWILIPESKNSESDSFAKSFKGIKQVLGKRAVWLQAAIVITAYCGYRVLDYYSLFAVEVLGMDDLSASKFVSNAAFIRPVAAVAAGFIADRISASKVIGRLFAVLMVVFIILAFIKPTSFGEQIIYANLLITFAAVYGIRGIYFALLNETKIRINLTGTAIGVISVIGYTPDIFFASLAGRILDADPGIVGYQHLFLLMAVFSFIGLGAIFGLRQLKT
jgi:predicted MFS family arabinose efflux permease